MLSLNRLYAEETPESAENSFDMEYQESLEAKISPILAIGDSAHLAHTNRVMHSPSLATPAKVRGHTWTLAGQINNRQRLQMLSLT